MYAPVTTQRATTTPHTVRRLRLRRRPDGSLPLLFASHSESVVPAAAGVCFERVGGGMEEGRSHRGVAPCCCILVSCQGSSPTQISMVTLSISPPRPGPAHRSGPQSLPPNLRSNNEGRRSAS